MISSLYVSSSLLDTTLTYNIHPHSPPSSVCMPSSDDGLFFYQNFMSIDDEYDTITSRQAVTKEINFNDITPLPTTCQPSPPSTMSTFEESLEHRLSDLLESLVMQNLTISTYILSSILRDVGDQIVELDISKV